MLAFFENSSAEEEEDQQVDGDFQYYTYKLERISHSNIGRATLGLEPWRMNICEFDYERFTLYIAGNNKISCLDIHELKLNKIFQTLRLYDDDDQINQIMLKSDFLFAVTQLSRVYIWDVENLKLHPMIFNNQYEGIEDCSNWSLDVYEKKILAVGSNSKRISLWNISQCNIISYNFNFDNYANLQEIKPLEKYYRLLEDNDYQKRYSLLVHNNNIPCVKFSPCGKYLASVSIDKFLRIFTMIDGILIQTSNLGDWGWGITWVDKKLLSFPLVFFKEGLDEYIIITSTKKTIQLHQSFNGNLDKITQWKCDTESAYYEYARYTILRYIPDYQILVAVGSHSPDLHLFYVGYNDIKQNVDIYLQEQVTLPHDSQWIGFSYMQNKKLTNNIFTFLAGVSLSGIISLFKLQTSYKDDKIKQIQMNELYL